MSKTMQLKDSALWQKSVNNNEDPYGSCILAYANQWALLMEAEIEKGSTVAECAKTMSHKADTQGITGFMYGAAVSILASAWVHGEDLRIWHNKDCQIMNEGDLANQTGGVLNPAILRL